MRVAIEEGLENIRSAVEAEGWQVIPLADAPLERVDAVVLTGMDDDVLGDETTSTRVPVISAVGLTAAEVVRRLQAGPRH